MKNMDCLFMIIVIIAIVSAVSGCAACLTTPVVKDYSENTTVLVSDDAITIMGIHTDQLYNQYSEKFWLSKGDYIIAWENSNRSKDTFWATLGGNGVNAFISQGSPIGSKDIVLETGHYRLIVIDGDNYNVTITKK